MKLTIGLILDDTLDRADGVQQAVLAIGKKLSERGHEVHYITSETERTDIPNVHSLAKPISLRFNGNSVRTPAPASKEKITKLFKDVSFDVLHVQMPYSPFLAARVLQAAPHYTKKIGTFHILPYSSFVSFSTRLLGLGLKKSLRQLDEVFAVSKPAGVFMEQSFGVSGSVLPNPVDYDFFHSFKRQKQSKKSIVYVGRFEARKGVKQLVEAYKEVKAFCEGDVELVMCGTGPLLKDVESRAKELKLSVIFPGFVSDNEKAQYLANADIAVFPSTNGESFGIVLAEAMAAGAGVTIGGDNPGYRSVLEAWPEVLVDPNNTAAFARCMRDFLQDDSARKKIGTQQHKAVKSYDVNAVVDRLEKAYSI